MGPYVENHKLTLNKQALRSLQDTVINRNLQNLLESVTTRALTVRGWVITADVSTQPRQRPWRQRYSQDPKFEYNYELYLTVAFSGKEKPNQNEFASLCRQIATRSAQPTFGRWVLAEVDGAPYHEETPSVDGERSVDIDLGYAAINIPKNWDSHFSHLYGLDSHILRVRRAIEAGNMSNWNNRFNCALVGPPGCGKSDVCQSIKRALGEDAVLEFDATATTAAGAIKELSEREVLPRVLIVEEIEKADEKSMSFLLSVLDLRGQIRKTTARNTIVRDTKLFGIATVNDIELFERLQAGALASRFANKIHFNRPSRTHLEMILGREVKRMDGDMRWVAPALDFCEAEGITDPRRVAAHCLCGREMLLDGTYQQLLRDTQDNES